ncbi:MAG TPA: 1-deoxy-D-xylulose-5-phosphate reductoisomerase [Thermomicrobiales bacterium]|nr:1-deoxy-D-xylulose-5-phosphate reductoisomerase [Thermomicrobiales bacterium]
MVKRIALLGSTGSIGRQTLEVVAAQPDRLRVVALAAGGNVALLNAQIREFQPEAVVVRDERDRAAVEAGGAAVHSGPGGLLALAMLLAADLVVVATSGHAAIRPTLAAIAAGKELALANKETIVCAGELVTAAARERGVLIRPVDSEHSALWQCLHGARGLGDIRRLIVTGSGGPFRTLPAADLAGVTVERALKHPTWPAMGGKITIDSATLMNKGLEVLEARWLFGLPLDRIDVLLNPQSIVHGLIEYTDGSTVAQLALPDMRLPIAYALSYPERPTNPFPRLDLARVGTLEFAAPDTERFPCLRLAYEAGRAGGLYPTVLSAADDEAVAAFMAGAIAFTRIPELIEAALAAYAGPAAVTVEAIEATDRWARALVRERVAGKA